MCSFALVPVPVVQRADTKIMNAIQRMNRSQPGSSRIKGRYAIQRISDGKTHSVIQRIEIYPVDSVIRPSNNRGQILTKRTSLCIEERFIQWK